jgi:ribosomal protein S18 acetylase RimI-like enzyme
MDLTIEARKVLDKEELQRVEELASLCQAEDHLDLKLEPRAGAAGAPPGHFLAYSRGNLVGYAGVDGGADPEACGMVRPDRRREGIGGRLLAQVLGVRAARGDSSVLVICEDGGPVALDWMRRRGATENHAEYRMLCEMPSTPTADPPARGVDLRPVTAADHGFIVGLLADGFPEYADDIAARVARPVPANETALILSAEGSVVGTVRLVRTPRRWMIYGLVIDASRRAQGYGTQAMGSLMEWLGARGATQVGLEVEPDNLPAVRLYRRFGFRTVTTYRYMRLATTP